MASEQDVDSQQAIVPIDLFSETIHAGPQNCSNSSHVGGNDNQVSVFVELWPQVPSLSSEEPEALLRLVSRLDEIYALGLIDDRMFVFCSLPLVSGAALRFFGDCLRNGRNWEQCKTELLNEIFLHFIREIMMRDNTILNFHEEGQSVREYIDREFAPAKF